MGSESIIEYTLSKVFGMIPNEDYFVHYRSLAEVAEEKRTDLKTSVDSMSDAVGPGTDMASSAIDAQVISSV